MRRNQFTEDNIEEEDAKLSDAQNSRRTKDNKAKEKAPSAEELSFKVEEPVFIISDRDKTKRREPYIMTHVFPETFK